MTVAPLARSAVTSIHGICPFSHAQDGVVGDPNPNLIRSLWAYDNSKATLPEVVGSMVRVSSFESALMAGEIPTGQTTPVPPDIIALYCDQPRRSALSSRFILYPDVFTDEQYGPPSVAGDLQNGFFNEQAYIAIFAPVTRLLVPSDVKVASDGANDVNYFCTAQAYNFQFSAYRTDTLERTNGSDYVPGGAVSSSSLFNFNGTLAPYSPVAPPEVFLTMFENDGSDGSPPVPVAQGRTPQQVADYAAANSDQLYLGYCFLRTDSGVGDPALIELSVGHSIAPVNG